MTNLRYMSNYRDGPPPPPLSPSTTPNPSVVNTLSRPKDSGQAPPPYRIPPSYPTSRSDDQTIEQSESKDEIDAPTDEAQLMTQGSPETLKVRK
ncbi:hypothetical protein LSH36_39g07009 [Paralvinella palmiformis]|uniref:Uncharacterized protein n=1 Tax=Paralvinella palmiformis TaxID=53620 RepID=A0AAD9K9C9_9ANNE|nr:hypothetical protein LSH36_39g07009 [Paralvinella palmiformis]